MSTAHDQRPRGRRTPPADLPATQPTDCAAGSQPTASALPPPALAQQPTASALPPPALAQQPGHFTELFDASPPGSSVVDGGPPRASSRASTAGAGAGVGRSNTLKKKNHSHSVKRANSLQRSGSTKSLRAGGRKGLGGVDADDAAYTSWSFTPVPTSGAPTDILANRFQAWRQLLKSLITYFREIQQAYETHTKALHKVQHAVANITSPSIFMSNGGLGDATRILEHFHSKSVREAQKARDIEADVTHALTGLRSDLAQKIKEIKSLSGDFKNSVEKERDVTMKEIEKLQEALQHADHEDGVASGKNDPYVVRLGVDRAIERQIDEENYLHRAYLNLEASGRELESIVVGEIQKAYNALAGILKREADDAYTAVESLRSGPIAMPKDQEWYQFVTSDEHFVDPALPLRRVEEIEYPGKHAPAATEIRAGMLERKSKYLKSYTPGWYVLSPTHLHEFKSADKIYSQPPVMSLYLPDQKLGSHSERASSSHKFMLKGKQSGALHKGHNWVFRAESYDTMMAWLDDIRNLIEKTGADRIAFVRKHARSVSGTSDRGTVSSDGMEDDEADQTPYTADVNSLAQRSPTSPKPQRPQPGGRFPSDVVLRTTGTTGSTGDGPDASDDDGPHAIPAAAAFLEPAAHDRYGGQDPYRLDDVRTEAGTIHDEPGVVLQQSAPLPRPQHAIASTTPAHTQTYAPPAADPAPPVHQVQPAPPPQPFFGHEPAPSLAPDPPESPARAGHPHGDRMAPDAAGAAACRRPQHDAVLSDPDPEPSPSDADAAAAFPHAVDTRNAPAPLPPTLSPSPSDTPSPPAHTCLPAPDHPAARPSAPPPPPRAVRHDTDLSASQLHVPGQFPPPS